MCLAQGPPRSDTGETRPAASQSRVKLSTTEPLRSLQRLCVGNELKHISETLTLKAPITTAVGDKFCDIFPSFRQK